MSIKNREDIRNLINKIELDYPVNEWMHNGYHIWPVLRIRLYLMMVRQYDGVRHGRSKKNKSYKDISKKMRGLYSSWLDYLKLSGNINTLYCGAASHRVDYLGKKYNRYFDSLMDKESQGNLLIEYSTSSKENYYKPERVLLVSDLIKCFNLYSKINDFRGRENEYAKKLDSILKKSEFEIDNFVSDTTRNITNVDRSVEFFHKLLHKTSPQKIYELCYYSTDMLGLNIAADRMGIPTIDMQHGPQGATHLAYGSWQNVPKKGYEALPGEFHTWDQSSAVSIQDWAKNTEKHSATLTGNPWVEGWKRGAFKSSDYSWPDKIVLYTLQPTGEPLEPYLLETIKETCDRWNWWLRLHPRQLAELQTIKQKFKKAGLIDKINIQDATKLPLPEILLHTKVHITKFSGCAIEAFSFRIPTIILDKRGEEMFEDYFNYEIMKSCTVEDSDILSKQIKSYM
jgi:hypothetical protein